MLLSIVSERTGYPQEMLNLNLDLEADLGIDSIKRVEILGTFQQSFAAAGVGLEEGLMEKLSGVRTLRGILDLIAKQPGDQAAQPLPARELTAGQPPAQVHPQVAAGPGKDELLSQLLSIVSDRTGYPQEMLNLNLDLEADLGIDSIKRVEILGTLQQSFVAAGVRFEEGLMEKLSGVRTLQGIIDRVFDQFGITPASAPAVKSVAATFSKPAEPTPVPASSQNEAGDEEQIGRYTLTAIETPLSGGAKRIAKDRTILITDDGHVVARSLVRELLSSGYKVATVRQGHSVQELDAGSYAANLASPESVAELIDLVIERQGSLAGIVHILSLAGEANFAAHDFHGWKEQLRHNVKSLFLLAKAGGKHLREAAGESGACLIAATGMGGSFLSDLPADAVANFPDHGAVAGLMKTLAVEWPEVCVKAVDLDLREGGDALARHLLDELQDGDSLVEVGYNGRRRVALKPAPAPLSLETGAAPVLDSSSVVLITGGARGITARAAIRLAELYQPTLLLVGRSPLPAPDEAAETAGINTSRELKAALMDQMRARGETVTPALVERAIARLTAEREIRGTLAALHQLGAPVHYYPVDVREAEAFGTLIDGIYTSFGRLDGVIHGAGVIEDKLIHDKTAKSFDRVFDTKVDSAFVLSRKLRPESLKFLLFFSSVAGRFGNRGQGDYAAANEVLNKLAVCLDRSWPGRVVAINWGPWDTQGMVSAEVRKQFAERGVKLISPATGLRLLEEEIKYGHRGEAEIVIGGAELPAAAPRVAAHGAWPLLGQAAISRGESSLEFVRELDTAYDLYLNDHQLDGQPVLPLAVATELMAEAVAQGWPEMQVAGVRSLRVLHGVVLESGAKTLRIVAKPEGGHASNPARVAVEVSGAGHPHRVHYRATIELASRLPDAPPLEVAPLSDGRAFSLEIAEIYRQWLFHGPLFQGISRADLIGVSGIKASLATSSPNTWIAGASDAPWLIDPLMFDSALQLLVVWAREHWDMTALPSGFRSFRRFAAPPASRILCELRIRPETGAQTIHADIFFIDAATGGVVGILEDMQGACSKALNRLAGRALAVAAGNES
jgi:NAD(P)-dependent dehydrogenase (short-subunit alcohol dehydrogenase family)/acyl carrier protein